VERRHFSGDGKSFLPHCVDDFTIDVDNSYSDDNVKALSEYKMESLLQRTVTQPQWKLPSLGLSVERYR
jgi:hypothetical protein